MIGHGHALGGTHMCAPRMKTLQRASLTTDAHAIPKHVRCVKNLRIHLNTASPTSTFQYYCNGFIYRPRPNSGNPPVSQL